MKKIYVFAGVAVLAMSLTYCSSSKKAAAVPKLLIQQMFLLLLLVIVPLAIFHQKVEIKRPTIIMQM